MFLHLVFFFKKKIIDKIVCIISWLLCLFYIFTDIKAQLLQSIRFSYPKYLYLLASFHYNENLGFLKGMIGGSILFFICNSSDETDTYVWIL